MKLWFSYRFIDLPFAALNILNAAASCVVIEKQRVVWVSTEAADAGADFDMDVTTAQLLSDCDFYERDRHKESDFLKVWSERLYEFSPHIETYSCPSLPHAGLLLEVSTCLALFSGQLALKKRMLDLFARHGLHVKFGAAHTATASWLLSFTDVEYSGNESRDDYIILLHQLPIQLIHDHAKTIESLEQTGFNTLGDLAHQIEKQTIAGIKKRFGKKFTDYICNTFDIDVDFQQASLFTKPVDTYKPIEIFSEELEFEFPTNNTALMEVPIESLLQNLSTYLRKRQLETQQIQWTLSDIHKSKECINVFADSPQNRWELFYNLTMIQLEHREFTFEVDTLALLCKNTSTVQTRSLVLAFDNSKQYRNYDQDFAITAAKLKARLGDDAVYKLSYKDVLIPEKSQEQISLNAKCNQILPISLLGVLRPTWLMPEPVPIEERSKGLYWRGYIHILAGPERIHGNWLDVSLGRDYFLAARHDHVRLWIFKDLYKKNWFVHGIFG